MDDSTRFKDLNAWVDKMMKVIQTQAHAQKETNDALTITRSRLDILESILEKLLLSAAQHNWHSSSSSKPTPDREEHPHSLSSGHP